MATNTNPGRSLSRRIRASLDVKRSKTDDSIPMSPPMSPTSPVFTKHFATQDPTVLRDAVAEAINDDSFQSAIAAHLAKLVEPSIKSALDTIQPVVEKVYQHEVSLRRINGSVEDILLTLHPAARGGSDNLSASYSKDSVSADEVKNMLSEHNSENSKGMSEMSNYLADIRGTITSAVADIADIKSASALSTQNLSAVKQVLGQSNADSSAIQAELAQLKADIGNLMAEMNLHGNNLQQIRNAGSNAEMLAAVQRSHASHSKALDELKAMDRSFTAATIPVFEKSHADTASAFEILTVNLKSIDQNLRTVSASNGKDFSDLKIKIDGIFSATETIKSREPSGDVLAAVQKLNDFHLAHAARLDKINQSSREPTSENPMPDYRSNLATLEEKVTSLTKAADSHTSSLQEVQRAISSDIAPSVKELAGLEQQLNTISATLNSQSNLLAESKEVEKSTEILTALRASNDSHAAHSNALGQLLDRDSSTQILTAIQNSHDLHSANYDEIRAGTKSASEFHASHTSALEAIQAANGDAAERLAEHTGSLGAFGTHMETVLVKLQEHSTVHSQIRDTVLASHDTLASNAATLEKTQVASSELLATTGDTYSLLKNHHDTLVSHKSVLDEIKSANKHEEIIGNLSAVKSSVDESKASVDAHGSTVKDLHSSMGKSIAEINNNLQALSAGVHLNEKGLDQLKDHVKVSDTVRESGVAQSRDFDGVRDEQKSHIGPFTKHIPEVGVAALAAVAGGGLAEVASRGFKHPSAEPAGELPEVQTEPAAEDEYTRETPDEKVSLDREIEIPSAAELALEPEPAMESLNVEPDHEPEPAMESLDVEPDHEPEPIAESLDVEPDHEPNQIAESWDVEPDHESEPIAETGEDISAEEASREAIHVEVPVEETLTEKMPATEPNPEIFVGEALATKSDPTIKVNAEEVIEEPTVEDAILTDSALEKTTSDAEDGPVSGVVADEALTREEPADIPYEERVEETPAEPTDNVVLEEAPVEKLSAEVPDEAHGGETSSELFEEPVEEPHFEVFKKAIREEKVPEELPTESLLQKSTAEEEAPEKPNVELPKMEYQIVEEPAAEQSLLAVPSAEQPNVKDEAAAKTTGDRPVAEALTIDEPVADATAEFLKTSKVSNVEHPFIDREALRIELATEESQGAEPLLKESVLEKPMEEPATVNSVIETEPDVISKSEPAVEDSTPDIKEDHHADIKELVSDSSTQLDSIIHDKPAADIEPSTKSEALSAEHTVKDAEVEAHSIKGHPTEKENLAEDDKSAKGAKLDQEVEQPKDATAVPEGYVKRVRFQEDADVKKAILDPKPSLHNPANKSALNGTAKDDLPVQETEPGLDKPSVEKPSAEEPTTETPVPGGPATTLSPAAEEAAPAAKPETEEGPAKNPAIVDPETKAADTKEPTVAVEAVGSSETV